MVNDLLSFNNGLEAIANSVEYRERRPQLIREALQSLENDVQNLRLVQEATAGNNDDWTEAARSIIELSEVGHQAEQIVDWRRNVNAGSTT